MITKIRKRNGDIVDFNPQKIQDAISKASAAVADEEISPAQLKELTKTVVAALPAGEIPTVEQVQDRVEEALIAADFAKTAREEGFKDIAAAFELVFTDPAAVQPPAAYQAVEEAQEEESDPQDEQE